MSRGQRPHLQSTALPMAQRVHQVNKLEENENRREEEMSQLNIFLNSNRKVNNFFWDISKTCFHVCSQSWHFPLPSNALLLCERCFSKSFKVGGCLDLVPPSFWPLGGLLPSIRTLPGSPISAPLPSSLPISQKPRCHRSHCTPCSIYTFSSAAEPGLKCTHHKVKNICSYI